MILSGYLGINDRADRAASSARIAARLADIDARRRTAELTVDTLVESWRGGAAVHEDSGWQEIDEASRDVIDSLSALLGAIDLARDEAAASSDRVTVPRQSDRRARPWDPPPSERQPGEVRSRPARRSGS